MRFLERHPLAIVAVFALATAHPTCDLIFDCGCTWFSFEHCNVHQTAGPRCPWCAEPWMFAAAVGTWIFGAWSGVRIIGHFTRKGLGAPLAAALFDFIVGVLISGGVTVAITGHPTLFGWSR